MLSRDICRLVAVGVMSAASSLFAADLTLVQDGKPMAVVVIPDGKDPQAATAAKVLVDHLAQMSGAKLEIRTAAELGETSVKEGVVTPAAGKVAPDVKAFVFVGESDLAKQAGFSNDGIDQGGILVKTAGNALGLIGSDAPGDPQTDTYAVVDFLESQGFRYLWPGESGKVIPQRSTVTVPTIDKKYSPGIKQRGIRIAGMSERPLTGLQHLGIDKDEYNKTFAKANETVSPISWSTWHRLGGATGISGGAAGGGLRGGWDQWGASHPEWFALQYDGTRDQSVAKERFRLCVSNQGLVEHVANDVIERIKENPKLTCISLCPNDGGVTAFCTCDECAKLDPPDAPKVKVTVYTHPGKSNEVKQIEVLSRTDRFVHYWNQIAERVTKVYPNQLLLVEAYSCYSLPPVREKLHPNLVVRYVPSTSDGWDGWKAAGAKRIYWRPNILISGRRDGMLMGMLGNLSREMNRMGDEMLVTDYDSIMNSWGVTGINYYGAACLDWNPHLTADQIRDDYCAGFGAAAPAMKAYFTRVEELSQAQMKALAEKPRMFSRQEVAELRKLLGDADKAAGDDKPTLERIAFVRMALNYSDVASAIVELNLQAKGKTGPELAAIKAQAQPLVALHWLVLRDITKNHTLVSWVPYLVWASDDFAAWSAIGGRSYQAPAELIALGDAHTQTGHEDSIDAMFASFGLNKEAVAQMKAPTKRGGDGKTDVDADENGNPIKVMK